MIEQWKGMKTNTFFTSDLHIGHDKVIQYSKRPFNNLREMEEVIIRNWNNKVKKDDVVWMLGDIFFCHQIPAKEFLDKLNGRKRLVKGNHDKMSDGQYLRLGFEIVLDEALLSLFGSKVRLSHFPRKSSLLSKIWSFIRYGYNINYQERRHNDEEWWLLHGHSHSTPKHKINYKRHSLDVGMDANNFTPLSIQEVESLIHKTKDK